MMFKRLQPISRHYRFSLLISIPPSLKKTQQLIILWHFNQHQVTEKINQKATLENHITHYEKVKLDVQGTLEELNATVASLQEELQVDFILLSYYFELQSHFFFFLSSSFL